MIICFNNKIPMDNKCVEEDFYSLTKSGLAPNQLLYIFRNILKPNDWQCDSATALCNGQPAKSNAKERFFWKL